MTIDITCFSRGMLSTIPIVLRKSKLVPIEEDVKVYLVTKERTERECIRFECTPFPYMFEANWNEDFDEILQDGELSVEYDDYKYDKKSYSYDDIKICVYNFVFSREFFLKKNIVQYENAMQKIIKIKTGL